MQVNDCTPVSYWGLNQLYYTRKKYFTNTPGVSCFQAELWRVLLPQTPRWVYCIFWIYITLLNLIESPLQFSGWYEAPFPFGKTDFTLTIENCADSGDFSGVGRDKQGEFSVRGQVEGTRVTFVKDYNDGSHTNIQYDGQIDDDHIEGLGRYLLSLFNWTIPIKKKF